MMTEKKSIAGLMFLFVCFTVIVFRQPSYASSPPLMNVPYIRVSWSEGQDTVRIDFMDSCTAEKEFKLFRKQLPGDWVERNSMNSGNPDSIGWKSFHDNLQAANTWYAYKIQAIGDTTSVFSPETTVYNYFPPSRNKHYSISFLSSLPATPVSWVEQVGDSLFFPTNQKDSLIVVDISDEINPQLKASIKFDEIPSRLSYSPIDARIKLGVHNGLFVYCAGNLLTAIDSIIHRYDSSTLKSIDSLRLNIPITGIAPLGDSGYLVKTGGSNAHPIMIKATGLEILPGSFQIDLIRGMTTFYTYVFCWASYNKKIVKITSNCNRKVKDTADNLFTLCDYSLDDQKPLSFSINRSYGTMFYQSSTVFDTSIVFSLSGFTNGPMVINAFDIADLHSNLPGLGTFIDSKFTGSKILRTIVDTVKKRLIIISNEAISMYRYKRSDVSIQNRNTLSQTHLSGLRVIHTPFSSSFAIVLPVDMADADLFFYDISGRLVDKVLKPRSNVVMWRPKTNGSGCYIVAARNGKRCLVERFVLK